MSQNHSIGVHTDLAYVPERARGAVIVIGTFDGIHQGHRAVIDKAKAVAGHDSIGILIFDPSARRYFNPKAPPMRLSSPRLQEQILTELGIAELFRIPFAENIQLMSAQEFAAQILGQALQARSVIVGEDFRFGHRRSGDVETLRRLGEQLGFQTLIVDNVTGQSDEKISSTRIREHIITGAMDQAKALLGRPYMLDGLVEQGRREGQALGWPTANMQTGEMITPPQGVYAARASIANEQQWRDGIVYYGGSPSIVLRAPVMETHLFDFSGNLYGQSLRVALYDFIRPDSKFANMDDLRQAIADDIIATRQALQRAGSAPLSLLI